MYVIQLIIHIYISYLPDNKNLRRQTNREFRVDVIIRLNGIVTIIIAVMNF